LSKHKVDTVDEQGDCKTTIRLKALQVSLFQN